VRRFRSGQATAVAIVALIAAIGIIFALIGRGPGWKPDPSSRPRLLLLTSLPIVFPEGFTLKGSKSPVLEKLEESFRVYPISIADRASLRGSKLLLMVQPQAQPAAVLVELDQWVRGGGHVLLLADPALEWPSERPFGDPLRPPLAYPDTGLLAHWGLRLYAPARLGPKSVKAGEGDIRTTAPGEMAATSADCTVEEGGFKAHCKIGRGEATVIADADFIDSERFGDSGLDLLAGELERLAH
jgi:hypothetical protein